MNLTLERGLFLAATSLALCAITTVAPRSAAASQAGNQNYVEVLQKSMFFYEAQRAGHLPANNRVTWRGDSVLGDGFDVGRDLSGGWFDAGDHVKFNFPMAFSATALAWGYLEFPEGYARGGQDVFLKSNLRWATDYLLACHASPNELYAQVGDGDEDHRFWVPAEVLHLRSRRPSYKIDPAHPGSDVAAETAAAMAAASLVFASDDPAYAQELVTHAAQLYDFADQYRGKYSDVIPAGNFYRSWSGYVDELVWGALWLYKATHEARYLDKAIAEFDNLPNEVGEAVKPYGWTVSWDDKSYAAYVLLSELTSDPRYREAAERHLEQWFTSSANDGKGPRFTPAGFPVLDSWASARYAANTAFLMEAYAGVLDGQPAKRDRYAARAKEIIDYILGDNPQGVSWVIGYGDRWPQFPHHRTAHGSWEANEQVPVETRHTLYGALVGGHRTPSDTDWTDSRSDYTANEVACDYNALFSGALAALARDFGGTALPSFPPREQPVGEFVVSSRINSESDGFTEVAVWVHNHTAWPARATDQLMFRYFVNISEGVALGYGPSDYSVRLNEPEAHATGLLPWDPDQHIYAVEVTFPTTMIYPGGQAESRVEAQLRVTAPVPSAWRGDNDWSYPADRSTLATNGHIALYDHGTKVLGEEPPRAAPAPAPK